MARAIIQEAEQDRQEIIGDPAREAVMEEAEMTLGPRGPAACKEIGVALTPEEVLQGTDLVWEVQAGLLLAEEVPVTRVTAADKAEAVDKVTVEVHPHREEASDPWIIPNPGRV